MARPMDMTAEFHFLAYYLHFVVRELFINVIYLLYCLFAIGKGREKMTELYRDLAFLAHF